MVKKIITRINDTLIIIFIELYIYIYIVYFSLYSSSNITNMWKVSWETIKVTRDKDDISILTSGWLSKQFNIIEDGWSLCSYFYGVYVAM